MWQLDVESLAFKTETARLKILLLEGLPSWAAATPGGRFEVTMALWRLLVKLLSPVRVAENMIKDLL